MLVVNMTIPLFFCWPSMSMVLAANIVTLPRPGVSLFMLTVPRISYLKVHQGEEVAHVKSQGRLKALSHSLHF